MAILYCHWDPWIILVYNKAIEDIFSNLKLLKKIHYVDKTLTVRCNAGSKRINIKGGLPRYEEVCFCADFIPNILLLTNVADHDSYHV